MIKLNDICIQYTAWCRRDTATSFNTHAMVNETGARPLATQWKSDETRYRIRETRPAERDRRIGREREIEIETLSNVLVKIKTICTDRCASSRCASRATLSNRHGVMTRSARPCVNIKGRRKWREREREKKNGRNTELGPRIRDNPCILHTVEINILIFSLGRYAHRAVLNSCRKIE